VTAGGGTSGTGGRWSPTLLEVGRQPHPGAWIGPGFPDWTTSPSNALLLRGAQHVVVDAGSGPLVDRWPYPGANADVVAALAGVGITPADIGVVVLTHLDDDHVGGVFDGHWPDVRPMFPDATIVVARDALAAAEQGDGPFADRLAELLHATGLLAPADDGDEVAPGIVLRAAPGHRVGHSIVVVDADEPFVHVADTVHHLAHVAHPEWDAAADSDVETALATRRRLLAEAADSGSLLVASHVPTSFRVARLDDGFEARHG
jgi:glyoxylase-like metal-dependent hydrolase (beta-lactamase superfamily II)